MGDINIEDWLIEVIINYHSGELNRGQADDLLVWINQEPENLEYFRQLGRIWLAAGVLSEQKFDANGSLEAIRLKKNDNQQNECQYDEI